MADCESGDRELRVYLANPGAILEDTPASVTPEEH
jgi:hypothetical protein